MSFDQLPLILALTSLNCALTALAGWCWYRVRKLARDASLSSLAKLRLEIAEYASVSESLTASFKRLNARYNMREAREKLNGGEHGEQLPLSAAPEREALRDVARKRGLMR